MAIKTVYECDRCRTGVSNPTRLKSIWVHNVDSSGKDNVLPLYHRHMCEQCHKAFESFMTIGLTVKR